MKVRIAFSYADLARFVQAQLDAGGLPGNSGSLTRIEIKPLRAIQFFVRDGRLESRLPLHISAGLPALRSLVPGFPGGVMRLGSVEMELMVEMATRLELDADLNLRGKTRASYEWIIPPKLGLALLKVPMDTLLAPTLQRELEKVAKEIDEQMIATLPIQHYVEDAWKSLFLPYLLEDSPLPFHLNINPQTAPIDRSGLTLGPKALHLDFFLRFNPQASLLAFQQKSSVPDLPSISLTESEIPDEKTEAALMLEWEELIPWLLRQDWPLFPPLQFLDLQQIEVKTVSPDELEVKLGLRVEWKIGPFRRRMQGTFQTHLVGGAREGRLQIYLKKPHRWNGKRLDRWLVARISSRRWQLISQSIHQALLDLQEKWIEDVQGIIANGLKQPGFLLEGQANSIDVEQMKFVEEGLFIQVGAQAKAQVNLMPEV